MNFLEYNTTLAICDTTIGNVIHRLFEKYPTASDSIKCSILTCKKLTTTSIPVTYITLLTVNGDLNNLQRNVQQRIETSISGCGHIENNGIPCTGEKTVSTNLSSMHLFIELLHWEGMHLFSVLD